MLDDAKIAACYDADLEDPNKADNITKIVHTDYLTCYCDMRRKNDEQSKELIVFYNMFANMYVELLNFKYNNTVWDPNDTPPYNDLTKAYYAAVKFFDIGF
eukprot:10871825-Ditylum_brightwellii.AAC.1